jgi:DNA mismatch repair ATPase MutS
MSFRSILFDQSDSGIDIDHQKEPEFFVDLNLDQIVAAITAGREEYNLTPFFHTSLRNVEMINYRHDVLRDLERQTLLLHIRSFAQRMRTMRDYLAQAEKLSYTYQKQSWFLHAVDTYCSAVRRLARDITIAGPRSRGFVALVGYLTNYTESSAFTSLVTETEKLRNDLSEIRYSLHLEGSRVMVGRYESDPDYGADVLRTFDRFKQGTPREYRFDFSSWPEMNHVEAAILERVAQLYPEIFASLGEYYAHHRFYVDSTIQLFDREVQFYVALLEHIELYKKVGLLFCYPTVTDETKEVCASETFDLALANKLLRTTASPPVTNDFYLRDRERILVVSGPNQGGKTTFARTFGQLHYLASVGCPVPGREARLYLFDRLFTHFERAEDLRNLSGKLEDDLLRIHRILEWATPDSILIMNESFVSTTLSDALFLSKQILGRIVQLDMLCVTVTFLDEMASLGEATVSMVSTVCPEDTAQRTFRIVRKPADGLAYAAAIAGKYYLTYESVKRRLAS